MPGISQGGGSSTDQFPKPLRRTKTDEFENWQNSSLGSYPHSGQGGLSGITPAVLQAKLRAQQASSPVQKTGLNGIRVQ